MNNIIDILDHIAEVNPDAILWDGFNDCIVGVSEKGSVIYEQSLMVSKLMEEDMTPEDAIEYLEFNTWNCYVGDFTPIHIRIFDVEALQKSLNGEGFDHYGGL